jgi:YHS domain-containing protein
MKHFSLFILALFISITATAQQYSTEDEFVLDGYDVTEYFNNKAVEGSKKFIGTFDGVKFKFVSKENLDKFNANPKKYVPQYGGFCAYALASRGERKEADPETYEIRDGKLFLFYNSWGINTYNKWISSDPKKLNAKADAIWLKIRDK